MTIKEIAEKAKKNTVTVQRWVRNYNEINSKDFESGTNSEVKDLGLLTFIDSKIKKQPVKSKIGPGTIINVKANPNPNFKLDKKERRIKDKQVTHEVIDLVAAAYSENEKEPENRKQLQERLSADWLVIVVLLVLLWCDMFAFGAIGAKEWGAKIPYAGIIFSIIGLASGIGSVVTYNRIENINTAEVWKWIFGALQFAVFILVINERWFYAEMVMTSMFVLVFIGVQRSIKK